MLESINDAAQAEQILEGRQAGRGVVSGLRRGGADLGPVRRNEGPTAVRQDQDPMRATLSVRLPENR